MLHKFFEDGDWFAQKRFGYGSGWPIAWQGWVLLISYIGFVSGLAFCLEHSDMPMRIITVAAIIVVTLLFMLVAKKRTKGGWHWRR